MTAKKKRPDVLCFVKTNYYPTTSQNIRSKMVVYDFAWHRLVAKVIDWSGTKFGMVDCEYMGVASLLRYLNKTHLPVESRVVVVISDKRTVEGLKAHLPTATGVSAECRADVLKQAEELTTLENEVILQYGKAWDVEKHFDKAKFAQRTGS